MDSPSIHAERLGLADVFALRCISDDQLVNLAGLGRGEGWAGNISIDPAREPLVAQAMSSLGMVRHDGPSTRIFGPYWTESAAITLVGDFVVVMAGPGVAAQNDADLIDFAGEFAWSVGEVSAEKRLADELEVTKAALTVASLATSTLDGFLSDLAVAASEALSCEFSAVVLLGDDPRLLLPEGRWTPDASADQILEALVPIVAAVETDRPVVAQDLRTDDPGAALSFGDGLVSRCIVPLRSPSLEGAIIVAHTDASPRGFTTLCQQVAASIGEQACRMLDSRLSEREVGVR